MKHEIGGYTGKHIACAGLHLTLIGHEVHGRRGAVDALLFGVYRNWRGKPLTAPEPDWLLRYAALVCGFLDGEVHNLSRIPLCMDGYSDFQRTVLVSARRIPWGETVSYAELAAMSGRPAAVRAAASVMRQNRFPLIVPCHRVIRSDGSIGGYGGSLQGKQVAIKKMLLEREKDKGLYEELHS
jgi:O-6-methylguanine DNA methyltransferase